MDSKAFVNWAISLLEGIEASAEKSEWCRSYSAGVNSGRENLLDCELSTFSDCAYQLGFVISNYQQVIAAWGLNEQCIVQSDAAWLEDCPYLCVLACISYHFQQDRFCEGALINKSIASGAMLRLFRCLNTLQHGTCYPTTLETLYRDRCKSIPKEPGVYRVIVPQGMEIQFEDTAINRAAPPYDAKLLTEKYRSCCDQEILYIGKAGGKSGLRQRLWQYMKCGWNEVGNHKGGRAIWQIKNAGILLLEYECCESCEKRESELLKAFREKNGRYPVANWKG